MGCDPCVTHLRQPRKHPGQESRGREAGEQMLHSEAARAGRIRTKQRASVQQGSRDTHTDTRMRHRRPPTPVADTKGLQFPSPPSPPWPRRPSASKPKHHELVEQGPINHQTPQLHPTALTPLLSHSGATPQAQFRAHRHPRDDQTAVTRGPGRSSQDPGHAASPSPARTSAPPSRRRRRRRRPPARCSAPRRTGT